MIIERETAAVCVNRESGATPEPDGIQSLRVE